MALAWTFVALVVAPPLLFFGPWALIAGLDKGFSAWDARTKRHARKRTHAPAYPTYIRRWNPERRAAEARAHAAYDKLFNVLLEAAPPAAGSGAPPRRAISGTRRR